MALPLITKQDVIDTLLATIPKYNPRIEVSGIYPSDDAVVAYGVYVEDPHTVDKTPYQLGVQYCGSVYSVTDELTILYVGYQNDEKSDSVLNAIQNLSSDLILMNGYHEMDFTQDTVIGNKSEKHTYTFTLRRLEFLN